MALNALELSKLTNNAEKKQHNRDDLHKITWCNHIPNELTDSINQFVENRKFMKRIIYFLSKYVIEFGFFSFLFERRKKMR